MPLQIHYPFKPFIITQHWGNPNPAYAQHFNDPKWKRHNGTDARAQFNEFGGDITTEFIVRCPVENFVVTNVQYVKDGGGHEIYLRSKTPLKIGDRECYATIIMCHAKCILVRAGQEPQIGEILMIADNTGFSTGLHTHIGLYRTDSLGRKLDTNDAKGSYNPELFFTKKYAADLATWPTHIMSNLRYYTYVLSGK